MPELKPAELDDDCVARLAALPMNAADRAEAIAEWKHCDASAASIADNVDQMRGVIRMLRHAFTTRRHRLDDR
ncbi:MAG TPA: hypothetical protein VNE58_13160 [Casimicrobiaceae bacterium]|nr:hypothetical protein [Casimicrobiaceae bacterium]